MHKVLIPYFLALVVTPPTHCLEGTLLVYFLFSSLMIFFLLWLRALSLQILSFGPKIDENYESIWKGLNKSSIVKCLRGFHGISRINHGICTIARGVIYLALHRLRSDLWWWYSSFLLLFQELLVRNPYCIWTKGKCCYCWKRDALSGLWLTFTKMIVSSSLQPIVNLDIGHLHPSAGYPMMFLSHKLPIEKVHKNISLSRYSLPKFIYAPLKVFWELLYIWKWWNFFVL